MKILRFVIHTATFIIGLLLVFRLILKFLTANPGTPFVAWTYGLTNPLVAPFAKILPNREFSGYVLDFATLAAFIVYAIAGSFLLTIFSRRDRKIEA